MRVRVFKERTVYNMQNRGEDTLTARQKAFSSSNGKATETNLAGEKVVKRPVSVVVGVILTCIMPILYSVVTLFLCVQMKASGEASALLILSLAMHAVTVIASIGVFHRMANARFVIAIMYLIALFGMRESPFIFLLPFLIPAIGLMLMFSPRANKWLRRR